jgi:hypothetical protein
MYLAEALSTLATVVQGCRRKNSPKHAHMWLCAQVAPDMNDVMNMLMGGKPGLILRQKILVHSTGSVVMHDTSDQPLLANEVMNAV